MLVYLESHLVHDHSIVFGDGAGFFETENLVEIGVANSDKSILWASRLFFEFLVVLRQKALAQVAICPLDG